MKMKTRTYDYPEYSAPDLSKFRDMDGFEFLTAIRESTGGPSIGYTLNFRLIEVERGLVRFRGEPTDFITNPLGSVHGGFAATLLDSCMACAVQTMVPRGYAYTTAELSVNMVRAMYPGTGAVIAEGKIVHAGRKISTAEGRLFGEADGKLYAHGTTTCAVFAIGE